MSIKHILALIIFSLVMTGCVNVRIVLFESKSDSNQTQTPQNNQTQTVSSDRQNTFPSYGKSIHTNPNNSMIKGY